MSTSSFPSPPRATAAVSGTTDDTASGATGQAQQTAGTAADEGKRVAGHAKDEAKQVVGEAKHQAANLVEDAKGQLNDQSRSQRDRLVSTLRDASDQLDGMANGDAPPSGLAQDLVRQAADRARRFSSSIDGREPVELLDEVRTYARRRPGTFLLAATAAGMVAGRLTRGARQSQSSQSNQSGWDGTSVDVEPRGTAAGYPTAGTGAPVVDPVADPVVDTGYPSTEPPVPGTVDPGTRGGL